MNESFFEVTINDSNRKRFFIQAALNERADHALSGLYYGYIYDYVHLYAWDMLQF